MADKSREQQKAGPSQLTTVLDPLRPAVVVRRRVTVLEGSGLNAPRAFSSEQADDLDDEDEDENGPPSSVNVARALASLRADELKRVEELLSADDADEEERTKSARAREQQEAAAAAVAPPPAPPVPTVTVGKTISLSKLADQMGMQAKDLTATLVASGFYSLHAKTILPRETARTIAEMNGWQVVELQTAEAEPEAAAVEEDAEEAPAASKPKSKKPKSAPVSSKKKR